MGDGARSGALIGIGRSADVYAHGDGLVLRRYRPGPRRGGLTAVQEAAVMEHVRAYGFPVPRVEAATGDDIIMERVGGPTMLFDLARRPWRVSHHAATLARLHQQLHRIPPPGWLERRMGDGDCLLHLDLHPENVLVTSSGPVVIDWPNVARGPAAADVAHTWIVMATAEVPGSRRARVLAAVGRKLFLHLFLRAFDRAEVAAQLAPVADRWLADRNVRDGERARAHRLLARAGMS